MSLLKVKVGEESDEGEKMDVGPLHALYVIG
jgi:hypothetical protein